MKKTVLYAFTGVLFLTALWGHLALGRLTAPPPLPEKPGRIISLAPSITETLYALGLGDSVTAVTRFCAYPPEAAQKPKVAGFGDVNYEAVLRQRPDLVILPSDKPLLKQDLERLGLAVLPFDTVSLAGYRESVERLGRAMRRADQFAAILHRLDRSLAEARARSAGKKRPRVLFAVMHSYEGLGRITEVYAIGRDGFYDELITAAGGENAYAGELPFPRLSREAIIFLNPDVIIDVIPGGQADDDSARQAWQSLGSVNAVKSGRIHILTDGADTVPGPRSHETLSKLSCAFHPVED